MILARKEELLRQKAVSAGAGPVTGQPVVKGTTPLSRR